MGVIKTCSEYLEESVWGGILDKGAGESIKKEDEYNPEYIDFGKDTTVYWADCALEIDGEIKFDYDWINGWIEHNGNGWRLPTENEVRQLNWERSIMYTTPYNDFEKGFIGFQMGDKNGNLIPDKLLKYRRIPSKTSNVDHFWTNDVHESDNYTNGFIRVYGFDNQFRFNIWIVNKNNRNPVFLVKDKK